MSGIGSLKKTTVSSAAGNLSNIQKRHSKTDHENFSQQSLSGTTGKKKCWNPTEVSISSEFPSPSLDSLSGIFKVPRLNGWSFDYNLFR